MHFKSSLQCLTVCPSACESRFRRWAFSFPVRVWTKETNEWDLPNKSLSGLKISCWPSRCREGLGGQVLFHCIFIRVDRLLNLLHLPSVHCSSGGLDVRIYIFRSKFLLHNRTSLRQTSTTVSGVQGPLNISYDETWYRVPDAPPILPVSKQIDSHIITF